jgi:hypothetical protein
MTTTKGEVESYCFFISEILASLVGTVKDSPKLYKISWFYLNDLPKKGVVF